MRTLPVSLCLTVALGCGYSSVPKQAEPARSVAALEIGCTNGPGETLPKTYEGGTIDGARYTNAIGDPPDAPVFNVLLNPLEARTHGTGKALAADVFLGGMKKDQILQIRVPICKPGGTVDLRGRNFSVTLYLDGPELTFPKPTAFWATAMLPQQWGPVGATITPVPTRADQIISGTIPNNEGGRTVQEIILSVAIGGWTGTTGWQGTVFWDDLTIE